MVRVVRPFWAFILSFVLTFALASCKLVDNSLSGDRSGGSDGGGDGGSDLIAISSSNAEITLNEGAPSNVILIFSRAVPVGTEISWEVEDLSGDFTVDNGTLQIEKGSSSAQFSLQPVNENLFEGDERFFLKIAGDKGIFFQEVTVPLLVVEASPQPVLSFAASTQSVAESAGAVAAAVYLSQASALTTVVTYSIGGTATQASDYTSSSTTSVAFAPGETSKNIDIFIIDDVALEGTEDVILTLDSVSYGAASIDATKKTHTLSIVDNDAPVGFSILGVVGGTDSTFDEWLSNGSEAEVHWEDTAGETSYDVTLYQSDGVTIQCATQSVGANSTSYAFAGCALSEGATYKVSVLAQSGGGPTPANNELFPFVVDTLPPGSFSISGVTGGTDVVADAVLAGSFYPVVHWNDASGESEYLVGVLENDGTTIKCPEVRLAANITAYSFSSCELDDGSSYKISIRAKDEVGFETAASNNLFAFTVTTTPAAFNITGVTGGSDLTPDGFMKSGIDVVVHWQAAGGAVNYDVTIYENDGMTVRCPTVNRPAGQTSYTFTGCPLELNETYQATVIAYDGDGAPFNAGNQYFPFLVQSGLYLSGSGGSYLYGNAITSCGGGATCNAANPYVASAALNIPRIRLSNNAVLTGTAWTAGPPQPGNGILEITAGEVQVDFGSVIHMDSRGYLMLNGPGAGSGTTNDGGSGAGHGGLGGYSENDNKEGGISYGSITSPTTLGSGGGTGYNNTAGGTGGGAIKMTISTGLRLNGIISANGGNGSNGSNESDGGGGSGGSILIQTAAVSGAGGTLRVNGGRGLDSGGAGAGGRIALIYSADNYSGGVSSIDMRAFSGTAQTLWAGGAGTIYLKDTVNDTNGRLIVDNNGNNYRSGRATPITATDIFDNILTANNGTLLIGSTESFTLDSSDLDIRICLEGALNLPGGVDDLTIKNGGFLEWRKAGAINFDILTIESGGILSHSSNGATEDYSLNLNVNALDLFGTIDVTGKGFRAGAGTGAGSTSYAGAGGAYGGKSGSGNSQTARSGYGSITNPNDLGSGGGEGFGGGMVRLNVIGNANISGEIIANGGSQAAGNGLSGGSGGTIYISAGTLSGTGGLLRANGGNGAATIGGAGSGGRIAVIYNSDSYLPLGISSLDLEAYGGSVGHRPGAAGTIFLKDTVNDSYGRLIVDNGPNLNYYEDITTQLITGDRFDDIDGGAGAGSNIEIAPGHTVTLPSATIDYRLINSGTLVLPSGSDLTIASGGVLEWRQLNPLIFNHLDIQSGGTLTHTFNGTVLQYKLDIQVVDLTVNGEINVTAKGYEQNQGPGKGGAGGAGGQQPASGAGYGGEGGDSSYKAGANAYGSVKNPQDIGSGGGSGWNTTGGRGGGLVLINSSGTTTINGFIRANGTNGTSEGAGRDGSGGSGGTVNILTTILSGSGGTIQANGGNGGATAGSGSGGRIAIVYDTDSYTGSISALSIKAFGGTTGTALAGAAGTIYLKDTVNDTNGRLVLDNGTNIHRSGVETPMPTGLSLDSWSVINNAAVVVKGTDTFTLPSNIFSGRFVVEGMINFPGGVKDLTLQNGAYFEWRRSDTLILNNLTVDAGATLSHSQNSTAESFLLKLQADNFTLNGSIDVTGRGYSGENGPGAPDSTPGGGAYGGQGGWGSTGTSSYTPGQAYGSITNPVNLGSGGSSGYGGGAVIINVSGNMVLNGTIYADGTDATSTHRSGGAGGTINIIAGTISGSGGMLRANGAKSQQGGIGGGGSGGRIAVVYDVDAYSPTNIRDLAMQAYGGKGHGTDGSAGTIYLKDTVNDTNGHLIVNNGPYFAYSLNHTPIEGTFDSVDFGTGVGIHIKPSASVTLPTSTVSYPLIVEGAVAFPGGNLTIANNGSVDWRNASPIALNSLTIDTGGVLTHSANTNAKAYFLDIQATSVTINGQINLNGKGYSGGNGPGAGGVEVWASLQGNVGQGGAYGGYGGLCLDGRCFIRSSGYGSETAPAELGSGGGNGSSGSGGAGGGFVKINATGTFSLSGSIVANGANGTGQYGADGGGGSGGSVYILAGTIAGGGGSIQANGGTGDSNGGCGSGGRISITYSTDSYIGGIGALGLSNNGNTACGARAGGPGTIFLKDTFNDTNGRLVISNNGLAFQSGQYAQVFDSIDFDSISVTGYGLEVPSGETLSLASSTLDFHLQVGGTINWPSSSITVTSTGSLSWAKLTSLVLDNLILQSGSVLTHKINQSVKASVLDVVINNDLIVEAGARIDASGKGLAPGEGAGGGETRPTSNHAGGGGGYGGAGGNGYNGTLGGGAYGSPTNPVDLGSGGSMGQYAASGWGGGAAIISIGNEFVFEGQVLANGNSDTWIYTEGSGGGSGGSINIVTNILSGESGVMSASGGDALNAAQGGGSGGGGRIRLSYTTDNYTGTASTITKQVNPGAAFTGFAGQAGTIEINP